MLFWSEQNARVGSAATANRTGLHATQKFPQFQNTKITHSYREILVLLFDE